MRLLGRDDDSDHCLLMGTMESVFGDDVHVLSREALRPELAGDMCSASHFALVTAYGDIKERLAGLERENAALRRRLKAYEDPVIGMFEDDGSFYELKENVSFQRQLNQFQHELQQHSEREDQLCNLVQAYQKLREEKSQLESELAGMRALVETHLSQICSLEQQLRDQQTESGSCPSLPSLPSLSLSPPLHSSELHYLSLHGPPGLGHALDPSLGWQRAGGLEAAGEVTLQRLEVALEGAQHEARAAQRREEQLQAELKQLQDTRAQDLASNQSERDMAWVKKVGDDQVNLALAYTELTEELGRLRELSALQGQILRSLLQDQARSSGQRHCPLSPLPPTPQRHSPAPLAPAPSPPGCPPLTSCPSPGPQRRSPGPLCPSPSPQRRSPASSCPSPALQPRLPSAGDRGLAEAAYAKPSSQLAKAGFQGRRSYSELANGTGYPAAVAAAAPGPWLQPETSTLPKPRTYGELFGAARPLSPRDSFEDARLHFDKQSSDEEEWAVPSPPSPDPGTIRCASFCAGFPIPEAPATYPSTEHAQSWPSINLLMETVGSDVRSCPLCQLGFPVGYPDDALIKHIDSHLENSKI
ncbi:TANK-binding kinase 1-binding protein 1 isoform X2 [Ornithorhynchus anatinus]|uniref:TANK-binding kinase 1-binding protein 1 isoform X2 n=1 Tax=Ornithorhynchus anatinus TaxID=9258 RepID=UPI0010A841A8|nr:TANK-binding kinase 1-binding protein 1 isoform X2 [Ornithorhynchus anatinus]